MKGPDVQVDYEFRLAQLDLYEAERHQNVYQLLDADARVESRIWDLPDS